MRYRKKPHVIEAIQWDGSIEGSETSAEAICTKFDTAFTWAGDKLGIPTLEGIMMASVGDYIIKGIKGECYPCKPDIFEMTYEPEDAVQEIEMPKYYRGNALTTTEVKDMLDKAGIKYNPECFIYKDRQ